VRDLDALDMCRSMGVCIYELSFQLCRCSQNGGQSYISTDYSIAQVLLTQVERGNETASHIKSEINEE
jgi:hypothetical protein